MSLRGDDLLNDMNKFAKLSAPIQEVAIPEWMENLMQKKTCTLENLMMKTLGNSSQSVNFTNELSSVSNL